MKGQLSGTSILDILQMLSFGNREGVLNIRRTGDLLSINEEAKIYIKGDKICFVSIEGTKTLLELAKQRVKEPLNIEEEEEVLKLLLDKDMLNIVSDIIKDRIMVILTWENGIYEFVETEVDLPGIYPISSLLLNIVSSIDERGLVQDVSPFSVAVIDPKNRVYEGLSVDEWKVLCWIDGKRNVLEISEISSLDYNRCVYAIKSLEKKGIISLTQPVNVPDKRKLKEEIINLYKSGRYDDVLDKIDHIIAIMPDDVELYLIKAESLYKLERYDDVVKVLSNIKDKTPEMLKLIGYALAGSGRFKEAIKVLESINETVLTEVLRILMDTLTRREEII